MTSNARLAAYSSRLALCMMGLALAQVLGYQLIGKNNLKSIYRSGLHEDYFASARDVQFLDGYYAGWICEGTTTPPVRKPIGWRSTEIKALFRAHGKDAELHSCPDKCLDAAVPLARDKDRILMYAEVNDWNSYADLFSVSIHESIFKVDELRGYWNTKKCIWVLLGWVEVQNAAHQHLRAYTGLGRLRRQP